MRGGYSKEQVERAEAARKRLARKGRAMSAAKHFKRKGKGRSSEQFWREEAEKKAGRIERAKELWRIPSSTIASVAKEMDLSQRTIREYLGIPEDVKDVKDVEL